MFTFFLVCAAVGGTILVCQFVMTLTGFGGDHDLAGHDVAGHDLAGHSVGGHEFGGSDGAGHGGAAHGAHGDHDSGDAATHDHHSATKLTWLFSFISFRSVVAGLAFFGLGGIAGIQSGLSRQWTVAVALLAAATAMYVVTMIMKGFARLAHDGTVRIQNAVGKQATVYIPIPGGNAGAGKVQMKVQNRLVEYAAVTSEPEKLSTGTQVEIVQVAGTGVLEVKRASEAVQVQL